MECFLLLAQATPETAEKGVGLLERLIAGGVPLICLAVAAIAVIAAVWQYRKNATLEESFRTELDARAKKAETDGDKRLADAKNEARERAVEVDKLQRERFAGEKESDATLAQAVRVIEQNTRMLEDVKRGLERLERKP